MPNVHRLALQLTSGQAGRAIASTPPQLRHQVAEAAKASFVSGLSDILVVGTIVAAVGAVLALALVRPQDFVASAPVPEPA